MNNHTSLARTNNAKYTIAAAASDALLRIIANIRYESNCWIWQGSTNASGYGTMTANGISVYVHRLAHWIVIGPVQDGWVVDHLCRTPSCVNPLHLEAVSTRENTRRGIGHASRKSCPSGHAYDAANTRLHTDSRGYTRRLCIACQNARNLSRRTAVS